MGFQEFSGPLEGTCIYLSDNRHVRYRVISTFVRCETVGAQARSLGDRFELIGVGVRHIDGDLGHFARGSNSDSCGFSQCGSRRAIRQADHDDLAMLFGTGDNSMSRVGRRFAQRSKGRENLVASLHVEDARGNVAVAIGHHKGCLRRN